MLDDAVHDKGEEGRARSAHGDEGSSALCASTLATKANGKDEGIDGALEEEEEDDGDDEEVRVGRTDNHREESEEETHGDARGEDCARLRESGVEDGEVGEAGRHESRDGKGGMSNEEVVGYRESDAVRLIGVGCLAGAIGRFLTRVGVVGEDGYHEALEVDAVALLSSDVGVLSDEGQNDAPCAQLKAARLPLRVRGEVLGRLF